MRVLFYFSLLFLFDSLLRFLLALGEVRALTLGGKAEIELRSSTSGPAADSVAAATAQVERIERAELRLCEFPELGQARPDIDANLRHWPDGSYVILYQVAATRLQIKLIITTSPENVLRESKSRS